MRIGIPTEVKNAEDRVALTPAGAHQLVAAGHEVLVQAGAGAGSAIPDQAYTAVGARILPQAAEVWAGADLICKVKEPVAAEYGFLREDLTLFTYLHAAADRPLTEALLGSGVTAIAYETVQLPDGSLPLLAPMSEVAGRLAVQIGAHYLMSSAGGAGRLLGGVPGVEPARVLVIGGGVAGRHAVEVALGMRAEVTVLDLSLPKLREIDAAFDGRVRTVASSALAIADRVADADLVIGAVLVPGARAPRLVTDAMVARMRPGSVLVDIAVDQGGCFESTRPTTHQDPVFTVHGSTFCCVANLPGAVPVTSTHALTNATLPYLSALADRGWRAALAADPALAGGLTAQGGQVRHPGVAAAHEMTFAPLA
ncbi:alanine dehydrogenase [Cellulomonas denverensis]|uniref:Alanine dehydrogenase n=1 Tax=Cellulomonas denverensis TaxID=264297 RepID=A0A7X6KUQ8_9CELL|nr:alanine dehydrogenase [Cellulomonas denverensis]NKY22160.1 alanine dehydrogenase [Cellulomonas denverensis]GIG27365.1 alanine dehydrogenase [Cellulomonas denverensis]